MSSPLSTLLEKIETLYQTTLTLTCELASASSESDISLSIEARRKETLEKADLVFEEVARFCSVEAPQKIISGQDFLDQKERLLHLVAQICAIDKKRVTLIEEEKSTLALELQSLRLLKQAAIQYQKSVPTQI